MKHKSLLSLIPITFLLAACTVEWHFYGDYTYDESNTYTEYTEPFNIIIMDADLQSVNIDWLAGEVIITDGEVFSVKETNTGKGTYYPLYYREKGLNVDIKYCKSGTTSEELTNTGKKLEITLPYYGLKDISLNIVSADYSIETNLDVDNIDVNMVSGNGNINVRSLVNFKEDVVSGNIDLQINQSTRLEKIEVDSVSGNTDIHLDGVRGYNLTFDSVSGRANKEFIDGTDSTLGKFDIDVDTVSGNLNIYKI